MTALDLWFGGRTRRQIADAGMAVCDLARLREWLLQAALGAGAQPLVGEVAVLRASEHG
ncbi:hypothetical protein Acsp03_69280 [Actinomadura sp. NBRC 104412]|uniref:hypothetical protein n=1 Tax=Actinomadura sp. NBRC 104412 TaxID=3032203 RepID=UPI0024A1DF4C|nr:hypothetical protein [Actinomadura sp. NBRC 104412]GLZ09462.1 hypothetical protein Acsp03_69280 [Actinomadura sp. NBRC 104412]